MICSAAHSTPLSRPGTVRPSPSLKKPVLARQSCFSPRLASCPSARLLFTAPTARKPRHSSRGLRQSRKASVSEGTELPPTEQQSRCVSEKPQTSDTSETAPYQGRCIPNLRVIWLLVLVLASLCPSSPVYASAAEKVADAARGKLADWLIPFLLAALPVIELRGAIPVSILILKLDPVLVFIMAVLGNMVPVPLILLGFDPLAKWGSQQSTRVRKFFEWLFERSRNKAAGWKDHEFAALVAFVGVPFPGTGAWSGSMVSCVLGMPFWKAVAANFFGVVIAGLIMLAVTMAGQWGWQFM